MYRVKVMKTVWFDDKEFNEGSDICFHYNGTKIVGNIEVIMEAVGSNQPYIILRQIEIWTAESEAPRVLDVNDSRVYYLSKISDVEECNQQIRGVS